MAAFRHRKVPCAKPPWHRLGAGNATATVNFTGELPLRGVQIMGVLETRSLDYTNHHEMSMNETVYPRRDSRPSFIPEALRHALRSTEAISSFRKAVWLPTSSACCRGRGEWCFYSTMHAP